jgi:hypothetical protein
MGRKREQRLRRRMRAAERQVEAMRPVVRVAQRYDAEIEQPNIREPWSIANWRDALRWTVQQFNKRQRRAA